MANAAPPASSAATVSLPFRLRARRRSRDLREIGIGLWWGRRRSPDRDGRVGRIDADEPLHVNAVDLVGRRVGALARRAALRRPNVSLVRLNGSGRASNRTQAVLPEGRGGESRRRWPSSCPRRGSPWPTGRSTRSAAGRSGGSPRRPTIDSRPHRTRSVPAGRSDGGSARRLRLGAMLGIANGGHSSSPVAGPGRDRPVVAAPGSSRR